ncbi:hypothetical protein HBI56_204600 [Parastagonospora nodorum]|nr:hypothetical protein HBH53_074840 [Parastagonospora nodorum]KAH3998475.1 hypothetical protein HBI10_123930 [Parastagonospora nodorum]KAH4024308.1 hypothetical protein HBI13_085600 [Parastagonospora nodorum]KAH4062035.1 hypothetical protein HBH50_213470 [Parastagonospora nodorum]KAH4088669.1 hypothetical protein HBH48_117500 [Parastagonospora nodorum]
MPHYTSEPLIDTSTPTGDWRDDLFRDGYVVVKNVLPAEKAEGYKQRMFEWLETFPYGFDKNDKSTWVKECLPEHMKGGMYHGYRVQHEKVIWDARCEQSIIDTFAKIWNTHNLLVSFDGMNLTLPSPDLKPSTPWPHVDQNPNRKGMQCVQGILNLAPNGPEDGGLVVLKGSHRQNEAFFKTHPETEGAGTWGSADWHGFNEEEVSWFKSRGCEEVKVCAGPGDLILWDSRTVHYNKVPSTQNVRAVMYICYTPASFAKEEDRERKAGYFRERWGTTHWPHANIFRQEDKHMRLGKPDSYVRDRPAHEPEESDLVLKLAGVKAY